MIDKGHRFYNSELPRGDTRARDFCKWVQDKQSVFVDTRIDAYPLNSLTGTAGKPAVVVEIVGNNPSRLNALIALIKVFARKKQAEVIVDSGVSKSLDLGYNCSLQFEFKPLPPKTFPTAM